MARFKTYNASAGAGKTYSLVYQYLLYCLSDDQPMRFKSVLAITFTNKAANEMKERILRQLTEFSDYKKGTVAPPMLKAIAATLGIDELTVKFRAEKLLKTILHNYSALSVSTIDKFTNRLIRSFAQDLNLSSNYEVELDSKAMLREAVDRFLAAVVENEYSAEILLQFIERQLSEGRSPRPENALIDIGQSLFEENAYAAINKLKSIVPEQFKKIKARLEREKESFENEIRARRQNMLELIAHAAIPPEAFNRGVVYNYIAKHLRLQDTGKAVPGKMVYAVIQDADTPFYAKSKAKQYAPAFEAIDLELRKQLARTVAYIEENLAEYELLDMILKDIYGLAVLNEIARHLQNIKAEQNRLPIGEFNQLISDRLSQEPAEYLFEKIGERYSYFFIDEFQDTSVLQWHNLLPLINNAMASTGQSMIVGDGKQSIYRWRGGEVGQFIALANNSDTSNKLSNGKEQIELYEREMLALPDNWRSRKTIVEFNNRFFALNGQFLEDEDYRALYTEGSHQNPRNEEEGFVSLRFVDSEVGAEAAYTEAQCTAIMEIVESRLANGFSKKDITILTRSNKRGADISNYLISKGYEVVSPDSLFVDQAAEVQLILSLLRIFSRPDVAEFRLPLINYLFENFEDDSKDPYAFQQEFLTQKPQALWHYIQSKLAGFDYQRLQASGLEAAVHHIIRVFSLPDQQNPFLQLFIDQVHTYQENEGSDVASFLRWWSDKGETKTLALPAEANAIRVMTIHKSKGLEFPVTILAFADWQATSENRPYAWMHFDEEEEDRLPAARLPLKNAAIPDSNTAYNQVKRQNDQKVLLDNLNLLYVAQTRAVDELHILAGQGLHNQNQRVYRYFERFCNEEGHESDISYGQPVVKPQDNFHLQKDEEPMPLYQPADWGEKLRVSITAPLNWEEGEAESTAYGKLMHSILARVEFASELKSVIASAEQQGEISAHESARLWQSLQQLSEHPELKPYYDTDLKVFNEVDLLAPGKPNYRPDRVVTKNGVAHIIDYKTGKVNDAYRNQVDNYRNILTQMGYKGGDNLLIYLGDEIKIDKWQSQNTLSLF